MAIRIGGNVSGNTTMVDGNNNVVGNDNVVGNNNVVTKKNMPAPESVDIKNELAELRKILAQLQSPDQKKINNAIGEAEDEIQKPEPDKDEVGKALERAMDYAKKAGTFSTVIETLKPHVLNISAWLGSNWDKIARMIGM